MTHDRPPEPLPLQLGPSYPRQTARIADMPGLKLQLWGLGDVAKWMP